MGKKIFDKCAVWFGSYLYYLAMGCYVILFISCILMGIVLFLYELAGCHIVSNILGMFFIVGPLGIWSYKNLRKH